MFEKPLSRFSAFQAVFLLLLISSTSCADSGSIEEKALTPVPTEIVQAIDALAKAAQLNGGNAWLITDVGNNYSIEETSSSLYKMVVSIPNDFLPKDVTYGALVVQKSVAVETSDKVHLAGPAALVSLFSLPAGNPITAPRDSMVLSLPHERIPKYEGKSLELTLGWVSETGKLIAIGSNSTNKTGTFVSVFSTGAGVSPTGYVSYLVRTREEKEICAGTISLQSANLSISYDDHFRMHFSAIGFSQISIEENLASDTTTPVNGGTMWLTRSYPTAPSVWITCPSGKRYGYEAADVVGTYGGQFEAWNWKESGQIIDDCSVPCVTHTGKLTSEGNYVWKSGDYQWQVVFSGEIPNVTWTTISNP